MRAVLLTLVTLAAGALAQNCGPQFANQRCPPGDCCSQYGWCDTSAAHCDPATCLRQFSGVGSSCSDGIITSTRSATSTQTSFPSEVPVIDVCGSGRGGVSCPGAGIDGYFYRCCSAAGHCGPKNTIQDQGDYCGTGCQAGFGKCDNGTPAPPNPAPAPGVAGAGETCGPIVNMRCAAGLCCSGSNFCGTSEDFCGAANWCQPGWGRCD